MRTEIQIALTFNLRRQVPRLFRTAQLEKDNLWSLSLPIFAMVNSFDNADNIGAAGATIKAWE